MTAPARWRRVDAVLLVVAGALLLVPPLTHIRLHRSHACHEVTTAPQRHSLYTRCG